MKGIRDNLYHEKDTLIAAKEALKILHSKLAAFVYPEEELKHMFRQCK